MILDNKKEIHCKQCNTKQIIYKMYIFNNLLYCFKCSIEKLKNNIKRY
jgi:late competence protein required for DNA uptake (superfamily II DNA/RNA helicase)